MRKAADPETWTRYEGLGRFVQRCRHGGCKGEVEVERDAHPPMMKCPKRRCGKLTCIKCDSIWHEGLSCEEAREKGKEKGEEMSELWVGKKTKTCPGEGCGVKIEKDGGCSFMTCEFCFSSLC